MARKKSAESGLNAEVRFHMEKLAEEFIAAGMDPGEAARRARLEFGGVDQIKEECRDVRGRWLEDLGKDLRYTARTLRRSPGFLAVAVLSLAMGIGANTAIFSLINAVMLQPLPVPEPGRLVQITRLMSNGKPGMLSYPVFEYFRDRVKSISGGFAAMQSGHAIVLDGVEETLNGEQVSGSYFSVMGLEPAAGRLLDPADQLPSGGPLPAVVSYRYWQRRFALDPRAIGQTLATRSRRFRIVGVMPARFQGVFRGRNLDLAVPLAPMLSEEQKRDASSTSLEFIARLKPGATREEAHAETQVLWETHLQVRAAEETDAKDRQRLLGQRAGAFNASTGINGLFWEYAEPLLVLMGIVALVLLLACANLAGLLLARAASRQREISIRLAMGAGRSRLIRQFLTESLVLATLGGASGLLLAGWLSRALVAMFANGGTLLLSVAPDWRVLAFTGAVSILACVLAGLAPGLHAMRANVNPALKEGRGGHRRLGRALMVAQLSISMVLVVGAALFIGTLVKLYSSDRGFKSDGVLTFQVRAIQSYPAPRALAIQAALVDRLGTVPGVSSASAAHLLPISQNVWTVRVQVDGYRFRADEGEEVAFNVLAPKYFTAIGTPLLLGREFDTRDTAPSKKVAIVNESFARYFFAEGSALGRQVTSHGTAFEIVGVVRDSRYQDLRSGIIKTMYIPWTQQSGQQPSNYTYVARVTGGNPMSIAPALDRVLKEIDLGLRLQTPRTYAAIIDQSTVTERIMATLGGFFGLLALIVACLGIFGVMAFQVSRRINELGLRMALGASRADIMRLVLREVVVMALAGSVVGGAAALALAGLASKLLFGVKATESGVFALSAVVLSLAALGAAWLPARRASRIDPMAALRHE